MPTRNTRKQYSASHFYHIYSRGVAKEPIFRNHEDYEYFLSLLARYLSDKPMASKARVTYPWYGNRLKLHAFCLMRNHIHILIYQEDAQAMTAFMHSVMTSYSMYFNKRYTRVGPVFQSRYLASSIDRQNYFEHITRYIHLNPRGWQTYRYSSLQYYQDAENSPEWLDLEPLLEMFDNNPHKYIEFLKDYESHKSMLDELKFELAHP